MRRHQLLVVLCHHAHIIAATLRFGRCFTLTFLVHNPLFLHELCSLLKESWYTVKVGHIRASYICMH